MRSQGHARTNATRPEAHAICDRCSFRYNLSDLSWQYQWRGTALQNIRILVCQPCLDRPQEQLRTIIIPMDPVPVMNARPENYVSDNNPDSPLGASPNFFMPLYGSRIGNMTEGGGLNAAFDSNPSKPAVQSAAISVSNSSYRNYVGINWSGINPTYINAPSSLLPPIIRHSLLSFSLYAPNDQSFLKGSATSYLVQSSPTDTSLTGAWTTISSGTTAGTAGEVISGTCTGGAYQFHRVSFLGDGINPIAVAQVKLNVAQTGSVATSGSS